MITLDSIAALREYRQRLAGSVGFVPTMGALHAGHLSLVEASCNECAHTIVSIYVNPTQFNNPNDLRNYPDTLDADLVLLEKAGVDAVFLPSYDLLYPDNFAYEVDEKILSQNLCGEHRPGHFTGVLTVVMKLLNLVKADAAYFGEKDYQQLALVRGMVDAFFLDTRIVGCPIVREADGLAMSSRNLNLSACDRKKSATFNHVLESAESDDEAIERLKEHGFNVDYVETKDQRRFGAVLMGSPESPVRLIDNVMIGV
jgi:pantoate--beta-alanine ligase